LQDLGVNGRIALTWILQKEDERLWTEFIWLMIVEVVSCCEHRNEPLGFVRCAQLFDLLGELLASK
jgi:hypothetical protein